MEYHGRKIEKEQRNDLRSETAKRSDMECHGSGASFGTHHVQYRRTGHGFDDRDVPVEGRKKEVDGFYWHGSKRDSH